MHKIIVRVEAPGHPHGWDDVEFVSPRPALVVEGGTVLKIIEGDAVHFYPLARVYGWASTLTE